MVDFFREMQVWKLSWRWGLFEWEISLLTNFLHGIQATPLQKIVKDAGMWKGDPTRLYTVKSAYRTLLLKINSHHIEVNSEFVDLIWKQQVSSKARFLCWNIMYGVL